MKLFFSYLIISLIFVVSCEKKSAKPTVEDSSVIAIVNGNQITANDFTREYNKFSRKGNELLTTDEQKQKLLSELINDEVLFIEAEKAKLHHEQPIKRMMIHEILKKDVDYERQITDEELRDYYSKNREEFVEVRVSHILFKADEKTYNWLKNKKGSTAPDTFEEFKAQKLEEAKKALLRIQNGESFEKVSRAVSTGPNKGAGGDLGYFNKTKMIPEFSQAAFSLKNIGDTSDVIETKFGYHIIKLTDRRILPFEKQKVLVKTEAVKAKKEEAQDNFIKDLKSKADVTILDDNFKKLLEELKK